MENDFIEKLEATFARFGKIAVDMGFITAEQLTKAVTEQVEDDLADKPHRPIGEILLESGLITIEQIDIVLTELVKLRKEHK